MLDELRLAIAFLFFSLCVTTPNTTLTIDNTPNVTEITQKPTNITSQDKLELGRSVTVPQNGSEINSEETIYSSEDMKIQEEWGGNCTTVVWDKCKVVKSWFGYYLNPKPNIEPKWLHHELDCKLEPVLCMKNGWSVNRCHILCMGSLCNKEILYKFETYVAHQGECKAHG